MAAVTGEVGDSLGESPAPQAPAQVEGAALAEEVAASHAHFAPCFARSEQRAWAGVYLRGLLLADLPRKKAEARALRLLGAGEGAEARVPPARGYPAAVHRGGRLGRRRHPGRTPTAG